MWFAASVNFSVWLLLQAAATEGFFLSLSLTAREIGHINVSCKHGSQVLGKNHDGSEKQNSNKSMTECIAPSKVKT